MIIWLAGTIIYNGGTVEGLWEVKLRVPELTVFQKNPFFLVHLHLTLLFPIATFPSSQTTMHVAPWQAVPATPVGRASSGQRLHSAAALTPTGWPHWSSDRVFHISRASLYVGCCHSATAAPAAIAVYLNNLFVSIKLNHFQTKKWHIFRYIDKGKKFYCWWQISNICHQYNVSFMASVGNYLNSYSYNKRVVFKIQFTWNNSFIDFYKSKRPLLFFWLIFSDLRKFKNSILKCQQNNARS